MGKITTKDFVFYFVHLLCYQTVWLQSILLASIDYTWSPFILAVVITSVQLLWHITQRPLNRGLIRFVLFFMLAALIGDSLLALTGMIHFKGAIMGLTAPFMLGLWLNFTVTFHCTVLFLRKRYVMLLIGSLLGFPLAYSLGASIGAATIPAIWNVLVIGIAWSLLFLATIYLYNRKESKFA